VVISLSCKLIVNHVLVYFDLNQIRIEKMDAYGDALTCGCRKIFVTGLVVEDDKVFGSGKRWLDMERWCAEEV
jgi:hypothetical protein